MTKNLIFTLTIAFVIVTGCNFNKTPDLQGVYVVGGFQQQPEINPDTLKNMAILKFGKAPFNFISKDSVILDKKFGEALFGASEFEYELTDKTLTFTKGNKRIAIDYTYDGVFRLNINNPYLVRLDLIRAKE